MEGGDATVTISILDTSDASVSAAAVHTSPERAIMEEDEGVLIRMAFNFGEDAVELYFADTRTARDFADSLRDALPAVALPF
jgi:hypothetical protein